MRRNFSRAVAKVRAILAAEGIALSDSATFERVYAGRHQRSAGAWSWVVRDQKTGLEFGSQFALRSLRPGKTTLAASGDIDPVP